MQGACVLSGMGEMGCGLRLAVAELAGLVDQDGVAGLAELVVFSLADVADWGGEPLLHTPCLSVR